MISVPVPVPVRAGSALLSLAFLAACAGNVADYVGSRSAIVAPELARYGLDATEARCVGDRLGTSLNPLQLRRFVRAAGAVRQGYFDPARLTVRDLVYVASSIADPQVRAAVDGANDGCGVSADPIAALAPVSPPDAGAAPPGPAAARPPTWLNLGAAGSGQSIAVDAATIEHQATARIGWFRMRNPGRPAPSNLVYRLRIDCAARTITPMAQRREDQAGNVTELREYGAGEEATSPIEGGTVTEIAYLSLCT